MLVCVQRSAPDSTQSTDSSGTMLEKSSVETGTISVSAVTDTTTTVTADTEADSFNGASEKSEEPQLPPIPDDLTSGKPWIDSCVAGNITADTETSPTEDFYAYVNKV